MKSSQHMQIWFFLVDKIACIHLNCIQTEQKAHKKFQQEKNTTTALEMLFSSARVPFSLIANLLNTNLQISI